MGSENPSAMLKVLKWQKRAIKIALKAPKITSTNFIFEWSKLKTIHGINKIHTATFMYKYEFG